MKRGDPSAVKVGGQEQSSAAPDPGADDRRSDALLAVLKRSEPPPWTAAETAAAWGRIDGTRTAVTPVRQWLAGLAGPWRLGWAFCAVAVLVGGGWMASQTRPAAPAHSATSPVRLGAWRLLSGGAKAFEPPATVPATEARPAPATATGGAPRYRLAAHTVLAMSDGRRLRAKDEATIGVRGDIVWLEAGGLEAEVPAEALAPLAFVTPEFRIRARGARVALRRTAAGSELSVQAGAVDVESPERMRLPAGERLSVPMATREPAALRPPIRPAAKKDTSEAATAGAPHTTAAGQTPARPESRRRSRPASKRRPPKRAPARATSGHSSSKSIAASPMEHPTAPSPAGPGLPAPAVNARRAAVRAELGRADSARRNGQWRAALRHYQNVIDHRDGAAYAEEALYRMAVLWKRLDDTEACRKMLRAGDARFPKGVLAEERRRLWEKLGRAP